ncbi:Uma2 family endonuclease [Agitococcus lubricus]|uniref:Uma2 family endonuclease n=1 Tax=Agitococcus lubricus TaxID=1077255 RepID=A0A2T5J4A7_9GAMM|nr:Uma2 family endonuclease [Agitococcus lubricus]PTQ91378.1 Uma2 family endonuclease [Agitococcus lubricus]
MASAVRNLDEPICEEAYLELEKQTDIRHEYIDGYVYAMVGGSFNHGRITQNLARKIGNYLEGKPCEVFAESTKVKMPMPYGRSNYVYPDVVVDCSVNKAEDNTLTTPVIVVEVLSKSTHYRDKVTKRHLYQQIETLQEYVLVEQDVVEVIIRRRRSNWISEEFFLGDSVTFESINLTLTVADIYDRVQNEEMADWLAQKTPDANNG